MEDINITWKRLEGYNPEHFWGRITYGDNEIETDGATIEELKKDFKQMLKDFYSINPEMISFTLTPA